MMPYIFAIIFATFSYMSAGEYSDFVVAIYAAISAACVFMGLLSEINRKDVKKESRE